MTLPELLALYESRLRELQIGFEQARLHGNLAATVLAVAIGLMLFLGISALRREVSAFWPSTSIPLAVAAAQRMHRDRRSQKRLSRLRRFYERSRERVLGNWAGKGPDGAEFEDPGHVYARDLNVFGEGSLFELLCTARTSIGRGGLADYLLKPAGIDEAVRRQDAVKELTGRVDLREQVALLGNFDFSESRWETFAEWLGAPALAHNVGLRMAALVTSALVVGIFLMGLLGLTLWSHVVMWIAPLIGFHAVVGWLFQGRVRQMFEWLRPVALETRVLREGFDVIEREEFKSVKLRELSDRVAGSSRVIRQLERLLNALLERSKDQFYYPSLAVLFATQICWAVEHWRSRYGAGLRVWLDAWAEFEALNALANYAYENDGNTYPEFSTGEAEFGAEELGHPLISREACVRNDIRLNGTSRFYVVSGSNMSGKSTLLRAIGLNAVLAFAGAPVRARALRLSELTVGASLSVVDSLLSGKSKFMAEVERLRCILDAAAEGPSGTPVLFLIDEIFAGTNSRDRRVAAESVVRTLISRGAIGALSTHDLALTEIADDVQLKGVNVHTGSRGGGDPMDFDYRLKPGVTNESNALAIARMTGVPV